MAVKLYEKIYPKGQHPPHEIFAATYQRLCKTGRLEPPLDWGSRVRTSAVEERILQYVACKTSMSSRDVASAFDVTHTIVLSILHERSVCHTCVLLP